MQLWITSFICHYGNHELWHFINFSKIDGEWFLFDDLSNKEAFKYGNFQTVKFNIEKQEFGFIYEQTRNGLAYKKERIVSKLKICNCFYERNILKGYEYIFKNSIYIHLKLLKLLKLWIKSFGNL